MTVLQSSVITGDKNLRTERTYDKQNHERVGINIQHTGSHTKVLPVKGENHNFYKDKNTCKWFCSTYKWGTGRIHNPFKELKYTPTGIKKKKKRERVDRKKEAQRIRWSYCWSHHRPAGRGLQMMEYGVWSFLHVRKSLEWKLESHRPVLEKWLTST